jgi:hypothetical protein
MEHEIHPYLALDRSFDTGQQTLARLSNEPFLQFGVRSRLHLSLVHNRSLTRVFRATREGLWRWACADGAMLGWSAREEEKVETGLLMDGTTGEGSPVRESPQVPTMTVSLHKGAA